MKVERLDELAFCAKGMFGGPGAIRLEPAELLHLVRCARIFARLDEAGVTSLETAEHVNGDWEVELMRGCTPIVNKVTRGGLVSALDVALDCAEAGGCAVSGEPVERLPLPEDRGGVRLAAGIPAMRLRDYFAAQVLAGYRYGEDAHPGDIAGWAYMVADAMLAERKRGAGEA